MPDSLTGGYRGEEILRCLRKGGLDWYSRYPKNFVLVFAQFNKFAIDKLSIDFRTVFNKTLCMKEVQNNF